MTRYVQLGIHGTLKCVDPVGPPIGNVLTPTWDAVNKWNITIPGAGTFYFPFGAERGGAMVETIHHSMSLVWTAALAGTFTLEATNMPRSQSGTEMGGPDVADYDPSGGAWQLFDITQAGMLYAVATGTGNSMSTKLTLTLGGTNAGGAFYNLPDLGMLRLRGKLVATVGGVIRVAANAKLGS